MRTYTFPASLLGRAWSCVSSARSTDTLRPILSAIRVEMFPAGVRLVATDTYWLVWCWVPTRGADAPSLTDEPTSSALVMDRLGLGARLMAVAAKDKTETATMVQNAKGVTLGYGGCKLSLEVFDGSTEFPRWARLVKDTTAVQTIALSPMLLGKVAALGRWHRSDPVPPLRWSFAGEEGPAQFSLESGGLLTRGLLMPVRPMSGSE